MKKINLDRDFILKIIVTSLIGVFLLISLITCANKDNSKSNPMNKPKSIQNKANANTITVSAKEMKYETIQQTIKLTGNVSSTSEINIYPDTSGKITQIIKNLGDNVKKGDIIAYVDPSKPGSAYSVSPVIATVSGTIIDLPISLGNTVSTSLIIATIGSLTDLQLTINVAEKYSNYLKPNLKGYVSLTSIPNETFLATVTKVSPVVNKINRTIEVKLSFAKYDARIKPGMFATINLVIQENNHTFVIPKSAIKKYNNKSTVLVIDQNNIAQRKEILTGLENDLFISISSESIKTGDKVIIAGSATTGSSVKIVGEK